MAYLGDLVVRLKAETADFRQDLERAQRKADVSFKAMAESAAKAGIAFAGLSILSAGTALVKVARDTLEAADAMKKLSDKTGVSTESLSGLVKAADLAGVSKEGLSIGLKKLASNMSDAAGGSTEMVRVFSTLGLSARDAATGGLKKTDDMMLEIADKFAGMEDGAGKSALAVKLFGKAGSDMIPMLNTLRETREEAKKFGAIYTTEFSRAAEAFNDSMRVMSYAIEGVKIKITESLMPRLTLLSREFAQNAADGNILMGVLSAISQLMGWSDPEVVKKQREQLQLTDQLLAAQDQLDRLRVSSKNPRVSGLASGELARAQSEVAQLQATMTSNAAFIDKMTKTPEVKALKKAPIIDQLKDPLAAFKEQVKILKSQASEEAAAMKAFEGAARALDHKIAELNGTTGYATMLYDVQTGALKNLTEADKLELLAKAKTLDGLKVEIAIRENAIERSAAQLRAQEDLTTGVQDYKDALKESLDDQAFQLSVLGKTRDEQEKLNAVRRIDLDLRRAMAALPDNDAMGGRMAEMMAAADAQKKLVLEGIEVRLRAERSWVTGAREAFEEYKDAATNAADITKRLFNTTFKGLEDAIVNFVKTGKLSFRDLANSIIEDLIRIQVRKQVTNALGQGLEGALGGLGKVFGSMFGGGSSVSAASAASGVGESYTFLAEGGPIWRGQTAVVGERGPEIISAGVNGNVTPNSVLGGPTFNVDMRGASVDAVARLESLVRQVNGSIEQRAVGAVMEARTRGVPV